jgi:hypothetical protein
MGLPGQVINWSPVDFESGQAEKFENAVRALQEAPAMTNGGSYPYSSYKHGDWGMVYGIVLPTL